MNDPIWRVMIAKQPRRVLRRLPSNLLKRIDKAILGLADDPRPPGCTKLAGYENLYRVRVGDWRISYSIEDEILVVLVVEVSPRGGAYRDL